MVAVTVTVSHCQNHLALKLLNNFFLKGLHTAPLTVSRTRIATKVVSVRLQGEN